MTKILTVGVYDFLHVGHVELFRRAKALGDRLAVAVQDTASVCRYKPAANVLYSTEERVRLVGAVRYVDDVMVYQDVDGIVKDVDFDIFVTGPDQTHEGFRRAVEWCEAHGKQHVVLPRTAGVSTSGLKASIIQNN